MKKYLLFVGIDISKNWIDVAFTINGQKQEMTHCRFLNKRSGFNKMIKWVKRESKRMKKKGSVLFCMEHTGVYTLPLCHFLKSEKMDYLLESSLRIHRSLGIRRGKDDKADSKDIARYVYLHREELKISELPSDILIQLKNLLSYRDRMIKQKVSISNSSKELYHFSRKDEEVNFIKDSSDNFIAMIKEELKKVEKRLKLIIESDSRIAELYELLTSIKGIGMITALQLIIQTNCFTSFKNWRKFAAYIGTAPFKEKSGKSLNRPAKVSKLAHAKVKVLLSNGIMSAIQNDKEIGLYYEKKIAEGKSKYKVFNAIKNKLLSRAFAVVKRGTPYVELYNYK